MTVEIRQADPDTVIAVMPAEIDATNAADVRETLLWALNGPAHTLAIDMSATIFCDVSGVRAIERAYRRARAGGTRLRLLAPDPGVRRILHLTGIHRIIPITTRGGPRPDGPAPRIAMAGNAATRCRSPWARLPA